MYFNRDLIISRVSESINTTLNGELVTGKITVDFLHYFPNTAVHISDVSFRDSLFRFHKMEFLHASDVYVKVNFKELFSSRPALENLTFENGSLFLFVDRTGYTNQYLLKSKGNAKTPGINNWLHEVNMKNFRFVFSDQGRGRYHNIFFHHLKCGIHEAENKIALAVKSDGKIKMLSFNLKKGAYAKDADFSNNLIFYYNKKDSVLEIPEHTFYLNHELVVAKAMFCFTEQAHFSADLNAPRILYDDALKLVTNRTKNLLSKYNIQRPLRIRLHMEGTLKKGELPTINAELITAANTVNYKDFTFLNCKLNLLYTNRSDTLKPVSPSNNEVVIKNFSGQWNGIPVISDTIRFYNFPFPSVMAKLHGSFKMRDLNKLPGSSVYNFSKGDGLYQLQIDAKSDSTAWDTDITLSVNLKNGALVYVPRGMSFQDVNAAMVIKNNDVFIQNVSCRVGSSFLSLKGQAPEILNANYTDPKKIQMSWEIKSSYINLNDFTTFLGRRKKGGEDARVVGKKDKSDFGKQLDRYLDACRLHMKLDIDAVRFDRFTATALSGVVQFTDDNWILDKIRFNHADGEVKLSGKLSPFGDNQQSVTIQTELKHVNISEVFSAFDNFSQQTITSTQINGTLDADVQLGFNINNKAQISQSSIKGIVNLSVLNGELKGFQPMGKLSRFIFRKRDFTDIKFSELTNSFEANGNEIYFDRMKINSSVMELYIEGSYYLNGNTDMRIQVPLSNLKTRDWSELSDNITDKGDKGVNIYIHAYTDEKGDLKFRYDPLKKLKDKRSRN